MNLKKFFFSAPNKRQLFENSDVLFVSIESQIGCSIEFSVCQFKRFKDTNVYKSNKERNLAGKYYEKPE